MSETATVASRLHPLVERMLGPDAPLRVRFWDGSAVGPADAPCTVVVRTPRALRRMAWAPGELGLARAYVAGDVDLEGDVWDLLAVRDHLGGARDHVAVGLGVTDLPEVVRALGRDVVGPPPPPPPEEARLGGRVRSLRRDRKAVQHHYDVGNRFYRLMLGPTMTYSCAYWAEGVEDLDAAQTAKYELICRKLGLGPGDRLLDVGCGWGGMVLHAARHHGVEAVGVTISEEQHALATDRVRQAGLADRVEVRLQDIREVADEPFDAISSIGMFEHVGESGGPEYARALHRLLRPQGRLLNHAISRPAGPSALDTRSFMGRYVFPDSELVEVGRVATMLQEAGFEVRDLESLREHYSRTLRAWSENLERHWDEAVADVGEGRARVWRLYLAGCALAFDDGRVSVHQLLAVRPDERGRSGMAPTRRDLLLPEGAPVPGTRRGGGIIDLTEVSAGRP